MSSLSTLLINIKQVLIDLKSDKANVRAHSLENFHNIFDNRSSDLCGILRSNNNNRTIDDDDDSFTWSQLFDGVHDAIRDQCSRINNSRTLPNQKTLITKNDAFKEALRKCINVANKQVPNVSYKKICQAAFECFESPSFREYFGALYLQIVYKHILNAKHNIGELNNTDWSRILSHVFNLFDQRNTSIQKLELLQCIPLILQHGSKYTYLVNELHQYSINIIQIANEGQLQNQINAQKQILLIVYEFIRNLAINHRSSMVAFTESVLEKLLKLYQFTMDPDSKLILMKIMHISVIVHSPEPMPVDHELVSRSERRKNFFQKNLADDTFVWNKHLRNMLSVIEREITESRKRANRLNPTPTLCPIFVRMAAKICSVVYWNDDIWLNGSENEEQQQKKRRHSMRLERIMELIEYEPSKYCWRWFAILSQLLVDFPHVLQAEDYQSLLKLLADFKKTIQYPLQMRCFNRIAEVMLNKEHDLKQNSTQIMESFCLKYWHEIMELSFKQAETDKIQLDNVELLRILIENKLIVSHDFIKNIITAVARTQTIKKSNNSIRLLTSILCNVQTDMIDGINDLKITIIQWLSSKIRLSELKKVIENNMIVDKHLESELYVLCVLSRQDNTCKKKYSLETEATQDEGNVHEYEEFLAELVQNLRYRMLSKLIVSNVVQVSMKNDLEAIESLPEGRDVKASLNETLFAELEKAIHDVNTSDDCSIENFNNICASLATTVNVLNSFVGYESMDAESFQKFLTKRVFFKITQLDLIVGKFGNSYRIDRNPNDVNEIIDGLIRVWNDKYHPIIAKNIFIIRNCSSIIKWLKTQLMHSRHDRSIVLQPLKMASQISFEERIQLKCLTLLAHFLENIEGDDKNLKVFEAVENYKFNYNRNEDLFIVFELIQVILNQRDPSKKQIEYAFGELQDICENQKSHCDYMELIVDQIPALIKCVKPYTDTVMLDDLITLISTILRLCKKKTFGHSITIKIIKCVQFLAQEFFDIGDAFKIIIYLVHFLHSEYFSIQMATVSVLANIFNKKWLNYNEDKVNCLVIQKFHIDLDFRLKIDDLKFNQDDDIDRKMCIASVRLQLYCALIGICYPLRKKTWFKLIEYVSCGQHLELNEVQIYEIVEKLCAELFQSTTSTLLADLLPYLISLWIDNDYLLTKFPTKLSNCPTQNDFIIEYMDTITLRIIQYKPTLINGLLRMAQTDKLANILTTPILVNCLAWLTSANMTPGTRKVKALEMLNTLLKEKPRIEDYFETHSLEIIEELITNMWDDDQFAKYFDTNVEYVPDDSTINYEIFTRSLEYVQKKSKKPSNVIHHFCTLSPRKVIKILFSLKLIFQKSVCEELKLTQLFRVCVLIETIVDFLIENAKQHDHVNTIEFFVRDFVYFLGNTINSECTEKLKLATCKYFHKFCKKILPVCATFFQSHLNFIVSILMPIVKTKQQTKIFDAGMALLHFLIADQTNVLKQAIGQLDSFPAQSEFDQLRQIQNDVKYNGTTFSLLDEIEYFLLVEKRKVEGLLSLKEHLSKKKNELRDIYKTIYDTRGFSEDCEKSPIHRLISALLSQIVQNVDIEKSLIAAKCLGELGPSDLGSIALKFDVQTQTYKVCKSFEEAVTNLCELAMEKLNGIFIHSDATVLEAASAACERMLQSQVACSFLDKYPMLSVFATGVVTQRPLTCESAQQLDILKLFNDEAFAKAYSFWVKSLAIELFKFFDGEPLASVAAKQTPFSVAMVPLLIKALLTDNNKNNHDALNTAVNLFFSKTFEKLSEGISNIDCNVAEVSPVYLNKVSIKLMLNVVECIRIHNQNSPTEDRLELNYLHIAKAALFCEAHFTAILYGELASCADSSGDNLNEIRSIMKIAYQSIGETDAVSAFIDPIKQKIEYLELNRCWDQIFIGMDAQPNEFSQYARYLGQAGLYNLANKLTQGSNSTNYECAWRLADWNIIEGDGQKTSIQSDNTSTEFDKYHYFALKNLKQRDLIGVRINIENALKAIIKSFKQSSYECTKNIYKNLMMLHLLQQVDEFCYIEFPNVDTESYGAEFIINKWKHQDQIASCGFGYREPILAQRVTMFQSAGVRAKRRIENVNTFGGIQQMVLNLVTECREEGFFNLGERYSVKLQKMSLTHEIKMKALIEDALLNWCRGEGDTTQHMIGAVISEKTPTFTHAKALGMMGEYLADARLEDVHTLIQTYLIPSIMFSTKLNQKFKNGISVGKSYHHSPEESERLFSENKKRKYQAIAKYADREYQRIAAYKKSNEFEKKLSNIQKNKAIANEMRQRANSLSNDEKRSYTLMTKTISIDESDVKSTNIEYEQYLQLAVEHYIQILLLETENEMSGSAIFRLFGLWFSNISNKDILKEIEENYKNIATYKFISLMPQITTHLSTDGIKDVIQDIVVKCAIHHPHHVLPKVMALFNAFKDEDFIPGSKQKSKNVSNSPRTDAAAKLIQKLKGESELRDIIIQMERMCEVLIRLGNTKIENSKEFPSKEPIRNLRDLDLVHCPTVSLPIKVSGDYSQSIVGINKWKSTFSVANGINAPKRIECIGLNGVQYSQLLKGTDDLRQDSVMQQVFNIMNDMLIKSKVTKKDRLHVRTYIIVPLSQRSGILEWCENTMPLTDYLVGSTKRKGAHERFRPQDWPPIECRKKLSQVSIRTTTFENTHKTYKTICDNIKPVFHHFFLEYFYNPGVWFERRMAYAHSLATTSMIGYILGIGDRHVSNILIDKTTAELIHIDFGIAFEQGKCLPTPEMIPFRLTRDLISALGPSGVEGVYRKSCEKTMEVLRQNKSTILTIVEVLLHDPLYAWTLTSNQANKRQQTTVQIDEDQDINSMAERALWRLEEKLDGKHVSRSDAISVKRHVEILIKEATNDKLLCKLFVGWQPYL